MLNQIATEEAVAGGLSKVFHFHGERRLLLLRVIMIVLVLNLIISSH